MNLQLLAITPAVLSLLSLNILSKTLLTLSRAVYQGRKLQSAAAITRDFRNNLRKLEKDLILPYSYKNIPQIPIYTTTTTNNNNKERIESLEETGKLLSGLFRLQTILSVHSNCFDITILSQIQVFLWLLLALCV